MAEQKKMEVLTKYDRAGQVGRDAYQFVCKAHEEEGFPFGTVNVQKCVVSAEDPHVAISTIGKTAIHIRFNTPEYGSTVVVKVVKVGPDGKDAPTFFIPSEVNALVKAADAVMNEAAEGGWKAVAAREAAAEKKAEAEKQAAYNALSAADKAAADKAAKDASKGKK